MPDLSKLPQHIRDTFSQTLPIRPDECRAAVMIFQVSKGFNHPNGRCNVAVYKREENAVINMDKGLQLDFAEFSGRQPLATAIIDKDSARTFIAGLLRAYSAIGGDVGQVVNEAQGLRVKEEGVAFFEDRNDD
jgi:hypothetical protein